MVALRASFGCRRRLAAILVQVHLPGMEESDMPPQLAIQTTRRCAIYTRKSVAQATDIEFGSLDAQRAICSHAAFMSAALAGSNRRP